MNIIWKDGQQDHNYATGFYPKDEFNTYTMEWTPNYVAWYINDHLVRKTENTPDVHFLTQPTQIMMNFWTPTWSPWNNKFSEEGLPWQAKYDFVETYTYNAYSNGFDFHWRDDFNTFDTSKWYKSDNWGFEGNSTLFVADQVTVADGNLVLTLDHAKNAKQEHFLQDAHPGHDAYAPHAPVAYHGDEHDPIKHYAHHDIHTKHDESHYDPHAFRPLTHHEHAGPQDIEKVHSDHKYTPGVYEKHEDLPDYMTHHTTDEYWKAAGHTSYYADPKHKPSEFEEGHFGFTDPEHVYEDTHDGHYDVDKSGRTHSHAFDFGHGFDRDVEELFYKAIGEAKELKAKKEA